MVKSIFNFTVHASDVVDQRTVAVSDKPHLGAELFPLYEPRPDVFPDMEYLSFERSIYNRLHGLKLRDSDASRSNLHVLERHWNEDSGRETALDLHRAVAKDILNPGCFQTDSSAIVLPLSRSCLLEKLHFALNQAKLSRTSQANDSNTSGGNASDSNATKSTLHFAQCSNAVELIHGEFDDLAEQLFLRPDLNGKQLSDKALILIQDNNGNHATREAKWWSCSDLTSQCNAVTKSLKSQSVKTYAMRFGTAPLWFLQSMATGPPTPKQLATVNECQWEKQASCLNIT